MLVVDDEPTIVVTLQDDLQELGFEVVAARDGRHRPAAAGRGAATRILEIAANLAGHAARLLVAGAEACWSNPFANGGVVAWLAARRSA